MEMFTSLAACKCVQRMYQNFSLGVFNSLQGNENQMISLSFFFFSKLVFFFLSVIMQLNNDECSRGKREREKKEERRKSERPADLEIKFPCGSQDPKGKS